LQSTLAANLSINSGTPVEFGQGISATTACSGETVLTMTPNSVFTNSAGSGAHYLGSITVSNIPLGCYGKDFTINAYNDSDSNTLNLFASTSKDVVIYDHAGTFEVGTGGTGMSISTGDRTFTVTFTVPVATATSVFKLTIQSGAHAANSDASSYIIGSTGPGGGVIYYVNEAGFSCGATFTSTGSPIGGKCHYLEVAPSGWNTGADPMKSWATGNSDPEVPANYANTDILVITNDLLAYNNVSGIGLGYKNSIAIVNQGNDNTTAAGTARAFAGGSKSDWYLPTSAELNLLCQWVRGVAPSVTTPCAGGTLNSGTYGAGSAGFAADVAPDLIYWSSSEADGSNAWRQSFYSGEASIDFKDYNDYFVRPIRAF